MSDPSIHRPPDLAGWSVLATIESILLRELESVRLELLAYPDDESVWALPEGLPNSGGNLALHLAGNLRHFIGAILGGTGYVRDRDREFAVRGLTRAALVQEIDATAADLRASFPRLSETDLARRYPEPIRDFTVDTGDFLLHLAGHLAYHLGQLSYHRRVVTGERAGVGALSPARLPSAAPRP